MEDALLKALFSQFNTSVDPFKGADPEKILSGMYGMGQGLAGTPYGMWGRMFGNIVPQFSIPSPLKQYAPKAYGVNLSTVIG